MTDLVDLVQNAIHNGARSVDDVHKMLAKQPADRPSMAALARELHALADSLVAAPELRAVG